MKIGIFTDGYLPQINGVSTSVESLVLALRKKGHIVYIIAPQMPHYKDDDPFTIRLRSIRLSKHADIRLAMQIPERNMMHILKLDFDIIHGHAGGPISLLGLQIAKFRTIPYVITYHTLWNRYTHYFLKGKVISPNTVEKISKFFGNKCDCLIAPTKRVEKELISYGVKKPIYVIPNGIDINLFRGENKSDLRKKLKIPSDSKVLLFAGRLEKEKSVDFLLKAFSKVILNEEHIYLLIVGEGSEMVSLKDTAKKLLLDGKIFFMGTIPHEKMPQMFRDVDLFVFSSKSETQGMVLIEAMASGLPVVAVRDKAYTDVIVDGYNGYMVDNDHNTFSKILLTVLNDDTLRLELGKNAKKYVQKFSIEKTATSIEDIYTSLIVQNDKSRASKMSVRFYRKLNSLINI